MSVSSRRRRVQTNYRTASSRAASGSDEVAVRDRVGTFGRVEPRSTITIDACVGGRDLTEPRLSADGRWLVVAVGDADGTALVRFDLDAVAPAAEPVVTTPAPRVGRGMGGGCWCFAAGDRAIVYAGVDGNLWWQALDDPASAPRRLTDHGPDRVAQAPHASADGGHVVYVVDQSEVWHLEVPTGSSVRLDDGSADFCFDPQVTPCGTAATWLAWNVPNMPWDHSRVVRASFDGRVREEFVPRHGVQQPRHAPDGTRVCVRDDTGWNNVWWGDRPLVDEPFEHAGPTWGLGQRSFDVSPDSTQVAYTRNESGFGRLCIAAVPGTRAGDGCADVGEAPAVRELGRGVHGQLSWSGGRIAALRTGARTPTELVVYDVATGDRRTVAVASTAVWDRDLLVEPETLTVPTDDGVVHARLYRADAAHRAPGEPPRTICWLHGGPTDQWQVTFMPRVAYWRAQGWDVLVPDHRGSTGHGRDYQQALRGRWGELDVADVAAVVRHAHHTGLAAPARTVLIGGSAGGFTVLGVLRHHPGAAAAAVVAYPVADLADLAERSHRFERHYTRTLVGEPPAPPAIDERARDRSPTWFADRITTPLLVLHGEDDPVVPVGQSRVLVERIRAAGGTVELVVYPGEGHGFRRREHQVDEYQRIAAFLARHVASATAER
jgi:dipeptidyl aminopeptidase/acylaminoacyl peptidase